MQERERPSLTVGALSGSPDATTPASPPILLSTAGFLSHAPSGRMNLEETRTHACTEDTPKRAKCPSALQRSRPTAACTGSTAKRAKCHFALQRSRPTATCTRAPQGGRSAPSPYKDPVLQPPGLRAPQGGRSATSPYKDPVPQPPVRGHTKEGEVPLRPTKIPSHSHLYEGTPKRAKCPSALQTARPTPPEGSARRAKCHILPEQPLEKAIQASSGKNSTEEYACEAPQRGG
jgi:hypothetical protein